MAVTTTTIAGTDSLSGSRITINDNFKTLEDALNSVLNVFDIVTGTFNNASYGSNNDILTNGIVINGSGLTNALTVNQADVNILNGNIKIASAYHLLIGSQLQLNQTNIDNNPSPGGSVPTWDLRSAGFATNPDQVAGMILPNLSAGAYNDIDDSAGTTLPLGTLVYTDENAVGGTDAPLRFFWDDGQGAGPQWFKIQMTAV